MSQAKALAKYYGLIETLDLDNLKLTGKTTTFKEEKDDLLFLIVIDFESTCWRKKSPRNAPEIIEFPALLLDLKRGTLVEEFHQFVMPMENPILSDFCTELTGITQEQVDNGVPLKTCLLLFNRWMTSVFTKYNLSKNVYEHTWALATWTDWDLKTCLNQECHRKCITKPDIFNAWIDLKLTYYKCYNEKPQSLGAAVAKQGMIFEGRLHSGIWDARNTARLAYKMNKDGYNLRITSRL